MNIFGKNSNFLEIFLPNFFILFNSNLTKKLLDHEEEILVCAVKFSQKNIKKLATGFVRAGY